MSPWPPKMGTRGLWEWEMRVKIWGSGLVAALAATLVMVVPMSPVFAAQKVKITVYLSALPVKAEAKQSSYDRELFPHWQTLGGCNTRARVLMAESLVKTTRNSYCTVKKGKWKSQYDNSVTTNPSTLDIDHRVPLAEAWRSGAHAWTTDRRKRFANDTDSAHSLEAVPASLNRSKSDLDPASWMPPKNRCDYARKWIIVKYRWGLSIDQSEKAALQRHLNSCSPKDLLVDKRSPVK